MFSELDWLGTLAWLQTYLAVCPLSIYPITVMYIFFPFSHNYTKLRKHKRIEFFKVLNFFRMGGTSNRSSLYKSLALR